MRDLVQRLGVVRTRKTLGMGEQTFDAVRFGGTVAPLTLERLRGALDIAERPAMLPTEVA